MQQLVEKYKPGTLDEFAGLDRPRAILRKLANSPYTSAWLLLGPSGIGKTTMALAVAQQIGSEVHHIPSRSCDLATVDRTCDLCHYYPWAGSWHFVLVDEADQMTKPAQLAFLSKLDTTATPPNTIFVFTANDTAKLEDRFLSRCRIIHFTQDGLIEPGCALLARIWEAEAGGAPPPDFGAIMTNSGCNIRQAIMLLELELLAPESRSLNEDPAPTAHFSTEDEGLDLEWLTWIEAQAAIVQPEAS